MAMRLFLVYVLAELAVVVGLASTIGIGWTFLILVGTFALGLAVAGSQIKRQVRLLQSGLTSPQGAVTDGALVALGVVLTVIPGLVTSVLGLLLLAPPTRVLARPAVAALAARGLGRMPLIVTTATGPRRARPGDYIDGEVVDVTDTERPGLPPTFGRPPAP
ncbi:FxsA family protein [Mycolicibacterium sediminis]|uniref:Membrane protein FxsA n=1 Tax=Mycolicibacterium sediminis TaxID=1286180 RepID=A0A7I7QVP0_9MYCO|nr:FxsA family protein [Mycolicibacterium sediminis]BBY30429.1 membrane protein FxsA [Mycolicibacterium sediminis]